MAQSARAQSRNRVTAGVKTSDETGLNLEFYQLLFSEALDGIFVYDLQGHYVEVNRRGCKMLGYTRSEILGMSMADMVPSEDLNTNPIRMDELLSGKTVVNERRLRRKDGSFLAVEITAHLLSNGNLAGIVRDKSEQKAAEERIHSLARFPAENPSPILRVGKNGKVLYANAASGPLLHHWGTEVGKSLPREAKKLIGGQGESVDVTCGDRIYSMAIVPVIEKDYVNLYGRDVTDQRWEDAIRNVRLQLLQFAHSHTLAEFLRAILDELERLTGSQVGFCHFLAEDQETLTLQTWSTQTVEKFCTIEDAGCHYNLSEAGVWMECVRERRAVIHNDYASLARRKPLPDGHAVVIRELVTPVLRGGKVVAIFGVGNKLEDYTGRDVEAVSNLADFAWNIADRKLTEDALRNAEEKYHSIFEGAVEGIYQSTPDGRFLTVNPALARMWGYDSPEDLIASVQNISRQIYVHPHRRDKFIKMLNEHGEARGFEYEVYCKDGEIVWASENARVVKDEDGNVLYYEGNVENITEQKWADLQMKRMLGIINASLNEVYVFNSKDWMFEYVNASARRNLKYSLKQFRMMTPVDIQPEFTDETFRDVIAPLEDGRESSIILETRHLRSNGTTYPVEIHLQLVGRGEDKTFLAVAFDITERRRSQQALRESEERIRHIVGHSSSMFYVHTTDHVLTYVSPQSREILDCAPEEAMVRWQEFISDHPANQKGVEATQRAIRTGQRQPPYELELNTHKGRKIWARVDESPIVENGITTAIVGSLTDITDRKQVEQALSESENLLREAQTVSGLGSYVLDIASGAWKTSGLLDQLLGIDESYEHTVKGWGGIIHEGDRKMIFDHFTNEVIGEGKNFDREYRIRRVNDGMERWMHGLGKLAMDADGRPIRMYGTIQDITERKRHDRELEASALLAQALSETLELQPLLDQLMKATCHAIPVGDKGSLALMTDDNNLEVRAAYGYQNPNVKGFTYPIEWGYGGRAVRQRRPILIDDIEQDSALQADASVTNLDEARFVRSAIAVPLLIHETAIGVLSVESSKPGTFTDKDLRLLVNFATSAALIIERARLFDETRRHAAETATLLQTSLALSDLDLATTLQTIGTHASALFETDACRIFLTDEAEADTLRCVLALGENQSALLGLKVRLNQGVTGDVAAKGQAEIVNDMNADPRSMQIQGTPEEVETIMFAPLKSGGQVIGVMSVKRLGLDHPFTPSDLELLKAFASMSASAVSNARLFEETRQQLSELAIIHQIAQRLTQLHTPDLLAQEIVKILEETLHYEFCVVLLISRDGARLEPFALSDQAQGKIVQEQDQEPVRGLEIEMGRGITGWVAEHGQGVRLSDVSHDPRYLALREDIQSELCVPLRIGERVIGVINVESPRPNAYSESDQRVLETIAAQVAISINNAELFDGTRQQVTELEMLYESGMELGQTLSPKEIGEKIIGLLGQKMGWHHVAVRLHHPQDDTFELCAFNQPGLASEDERREAARNFNALMPGPAKGLTGWAFQNLQVIRSGNVRSDPRFVETYPNLNSGLYVPIQSGKKAIGMLSIASEQPNAFTEADERLAVTLANQAASALENARLFGEARQRVAKLETINRVSIALRAITNQKAILSIVLEEALKALNLTAGSIRLWDRETLELRQEAARGWTADLGNETIRPGEGIIGKVFESGQMHVTRDLHGDPWSLPEARHKAPKNWGGIFAPISSSHEPLGVLLIAAPSSREFNKEETRMLTTLAEMTGAALHRMNLLDETLRRAREFESLYETSRRISTEVDLTALLQMIVSSATEMLGASAGGLYLYDAASQEVEVVASTALAIPLGTRLKLNEGAAGKVAQSRHSMRLDDYSAWDGRSSKFAHTPIRALLEVPIIYVGELIGVLVVEEMGSSTRKYSEADERLLSLFALQAAGAIKSARLHEEMLHRLKQLQALRVIDRAIAGSFDKRVTLNILIDQIISLLNADAADVLLLNPHLQTLRFAAGHGFYTRLNDAMEYHMSASFAGRAVFERRIQSVQDPADASMNPEFPQFWRQESFSSYHVVPLIAKGQVIGVIEVFHRSPFQPDAEWINFLETLADQTAIALDSAKMFEDAQSANMELSLAYEATIEGWSRAMDLRDEETEGHTQRVTEMALVLARMMGFGDEELLHVRRGALLHDIGKIGVPDRILHKRGRLTDEEWVTMREHPRFAYEMLLPIAYLRQSLDIPYKHHEKWDGTGYPQGLSGDQIPLSARIFAVVDVYDALTSDRPYRNAWTHEQTVQYIREQSGKQFDPFIVEKFIEVFGEKRLNP